ncbi:MAG: hypothetical protein ISS15_14860 [Alphaproteobacteria bacterium]|nr:hypothetical protein [Alphaproteobacteria bacterium]MBL6937598.1 hypothetical protein [Alphaproteobacteria bacterium]MBL7098936.1 hypothetical protein [Alphaproteobacteria bacterium]
MLDWAVPVLLVTLVALLAAAALWPDAEGKPRTGIILAAGAIAPLLIWTSLTAADQNGRFGDLRLSVVSLKLAPDAIDGATIGGDRAHDILLVGDLPAGLVTLKRLDAGRVALDVARPQRGEFAGAVAFEPVDVAWWKRLFAAPARFVGERAVRAGEVFCPVGCDDPCRIRLTGNDDRLTVDNQADTPRMETRGSIISWGPAQRIYPLRTFAAGSVCEEALQGDGDKNGLPVTAVLFRHGGFDNHLYGLFLDPPELAHGDAVLTVGGPALRIHLYRVDYNADGAAEEHDHPSRVVERRSVTARLDARGNLLISFDTPEYLQLPAHAIASVIASRHGDDIVLPIDNDRSSGRPFVGDSTLQFRSLGGQLAETALGRLLLHPDRKTKQLQPYFSIVGGGQTRNVQFGEHFSLGSSYSAEFALERLDRDNGLLGLIGLPFLVLAAATLLGATWPQRRQSPTVFALLTLVEVLLAFRVMIAVSGAYVDAGAARALIVPSALFAYLSVPFLVSYTAGVRRPLLASFAYAALVGAFAFVALQGPGLDKTSWMIGAAVFAAFLFEAITQPALPKAIHSAIASLGARLRAPFALFHSRLREQSFYPPDALRPLIWVFVLVGVRLALLLVGVKEGIPLFGFRIALSTIYLPLGLLLLARLLVALHSEDGALWRPLVWTFAAGIIFATPIAAHDTGFIIFALGTASLGIVALMIGRTDTATWAAALVGLPAGFLLLSYVLLHSFVIDTTRDFVIAAAAAAVAVALGVAAMQASDRLARIASALPLAILVAATALLVVPFLILADWVDATLIAFAAVLVFALLWRRPTAAWAMGMAVAIGLGLSFQLPILASTAAPDRSAARELDDQMQKTQNILRLWYSVRPGDVGDFATSNAQNLGAVMAHLHDYGACPASLWPGCLAGHGFLAIPRPTVLAPYHLNDNVTAIHLIAPFGRLGAAAFLLLLAAAAYLYTRQALRDGDPPPLRLTGIGALWTMFGAALYMILANLEVLPFTGKNVYFLAAASGSDLLEGAILIAIAMVAIRRRPA